ncbi:MAG: hypothetical protein JO256_08945, partial [Alphaproteobacteria bacterium]|nr:hypothetical protein [Alphaproteobacteria bacterium]
MRPSPRPALKADALSDQPIDLSHALPGKTLAKLPSSAEQLKVLDSQLKLQTPQVAAAKHKSDALAAEAVALRQKLIATAAH